MSIFWRYWLFQVPGWVILGALLIAAHESLGLSPLTAALVLGLWLVKDILLYPVLKPHYVFKEREAHHALLGEKAVAQETLDPRGYVKLRGELWKAELVDDDSPVQRGESVVVKSVDGLTLKVRR